MDQRASSFSVNGVTVDFVAETVTGPDGGGIALRPQTFAVLRELAQSGGRLVTKDELMSTVWADIAVTDDSLVQCIHEIRRALRDDAHVLLKTVPRRGYRFKLPERAGNDTAAASPPRETAARRVVFSPFRLGLLGVIVAVAIGLTGLATWQLRPQVVAPTPRGAQLPLIAVLPFDNLGDDAAETYFADGITEDLITDLSKVSGLLVIARNSVWEYRTKNADIKAIAQDLGADYVLEGSVRRAGESVRINAQLIDATDARHIWANRYDGTLNDVFALQDNVIGNIVSALAVELTSSEQAIAGETETPFPLAYDAVLQGLDHLHRDTEVETLKAVEIFEKAVAIDPNYSRAYAALAAAHWRVVVSYWFVTAGTGFAHSYEGYKQNLAKAMEHPTALAYATLAANLNYEGRYPEALEAIEKAMALAPSDPENHVVKASILNAIGKAAQGEVEIRLATRLDPKYPPGTLRVLSVSLYAQGRYAGAVETVERIAAQQAMELSDYMTLAAALGQLGRSAEVPPVIEAYNKAALAAAFDPFTVSESEQFWMGDSFNAYRPYMDALADGLRKARVPEGAGADLRLADIRPLMMRSEGEYSIAGTTKIEQITAMRLHDRGVPFVDLRSHLDYANGHVPGAVNLSLTIDLSKETLGKVAQPDDEVVFYCHGKYCPVSPYGTAKAVRWGYSHVYYFAGGFPAWQDAGYPVEMGAGES